MLRSRLRTYICVRLMEGADFYQLAKNCCTSVEMIEKHYAAHIKNTLDAGLINVRKSKKSSKSVKDTDEDEDLQKQGGSCPHDKVV